MSQENTAELSLLASLVGECVQASHPTLLGRVCVRLNGSTESTWLPTLRGISVRVGDRVLVTRPANWDEPIVTGVIGGFARRPQLERDAAREIRLQPDEVIRIRGADGEALIDVASGEDGPELTIAQDGAQLEVDGALRIGAKSITLRAREGEARIEASDDVVVEGENIHLN